MRDQAELREGGEEESQTMYRQQGKSIHIVLNVDPIANALPVFTADELESLRRDVQYGRASFVTIAIIY